MSSKTNFADPNFEPDDEQLEELIREAFEPVKRANEEALRVLRAKIDAERSRVLAAYAAKVASFRP